MPPDLTGQLTYLSPDGTEGLSRLGRGYHRNYAGSDLATVCHIYDFAFLAHAAQDVARPSTQFTDVDCFVCGEPPDVYPNVHSLHHTLLGHTDERGSVGIITAHRNSIRVFTARDKVPRSKQLLTSQDRDLPVLTGED